MCDELFIFPGKIRGLLPYQPVYSKEMVERIDKIDKIVRSNRPSFSFQPLDCYCNYKVSGLPLFGEDISRVTFTMITW